MESWELRAVEGDDVDSIEYVESPEPSQTPTRTTIVVPPPLGIIATTFSQPPSPSSSSSSALSDAHGNKLLKARRNGDRRHRITCHHRREEPSRGATVRAWHQVVAQVMNRYLSLFSACRCSIHRWGCPPGKFPLKFDAQETCYLLKGRVKASVKGSSECVEFGARDLVIFPKGLSCTWDVSVAVDKHYKFDSSSS
ncbi:hypothetical protein B296_00044589 [Ensete ventricosum]|uniref:(S)-ureidoglycine aminohydrolase cupin domain-containing protein n=1 Tax=Ensete ventricosum TaxID=4639 RepID=A0A426ZAJ2_ENSVE|nr:hypothetical protein B296_00044589 [Ensete ventricosum]